MLNVVMLSVVASIFCGGSSSDEIELKSRNFFKTKIPSEEEEVILEMIEKVCLIQFHPLSHLFQKLSTFQSHKTFFRCH
jgi:hypothetical protein